MGITLFYSLKKEEVICDFLIGERVSFKFVVSLYFAEIILLFALSFLFT